MLLVNVSKDRFEIRMVALLKHSSSLLLDKLVDGGIVRFMPMYFGRFFAMRMRVTARAPFSENEQ